MHEADVGIQLQGESSILGRCHIYYTNRPQSQYPDFSGSDVELLELLAKAYKEVSLTLCDHERKALCRTWQAKEGLWCFNTRLLGFLPPNWAPEWLG